MQLCERLQSIKALVRCPIRPKRFRVTGYDDNGDIQAFETNSRKRAKAMDAQMKEDLGDVSLEMQWRV